MSVDVIALAEYLVSTTPQKMISKAVATSDVEAKIVDLNTRGQLGKFEDSEGTPLADNDPRGGYSLLTQLDKGVGQRDVNLKDTGDYWKSFEVNPIEGDGYEINSDPIKDGESLESRWGDKLEGLTDENKIKADEIIEEKIWEQVQRAL